MPQSNNNSSTEWFSNWFDTPYYHILYKNRNNEEAQFFIDNLTQYLNIPEDGKILDIACGKGRHAQYLNQLGYNVKGVDLSKNSIDEAKKIENNRLHFEVHDMRLPFEEQYDTVLNLFTSFGYFENENDTVQSLKNMKNAINEYGIGVIDFMNTEKVIDNLILNETKSVDGITFAIERKVENGKIIKKISFKDQGKSFEYYEKVSAYKLADFEKLFELADIHLLDIFGDYKLKKYFPKESDRLILLFK